jgi:hypothetical protein
MARQVAQGFRLSPQQRRLWSIHDESESSESPYRVQGELPDCWRARQIGRIGPLGGIRLTRRARLILFRRSRAFLLTI